MKVTDWNTLYIGGIQPPAGAGVERVARLQEARWREYQVADLDDLQTGQFL